MGANSAHSCRVGFVFLAEAEPQCSRISNAIAHHTTEVGIVYDRSGTNIEVEHVLLSDNRIGLAIMPGHWPLKHFENSSHRVQQQWGCGLHF